MATIDKNYCTEYYRYETIRPSKEVIYRKVVAYGIINH
nr:MAG TPA: hypothetical protein [Caudoviricetes sp.]